MPRVAALALVVACLLAGCNAPSGGSEPLPEAWRGRDLREPGWFNETVPAGWTLVLEYEWSSGTRIHWDWVSLEQKFIHFQVVRMQDGKAARPALHWMDALDDQGQATVVQGGTHQYGWVNEYWQPIPLAIKVPPGYTERLHPPGQGPGCVQTLLC